MERIDSEERLKSSICSSDVLSHVPSVSSMSDSVFESGTEKGNNVQQDIPMATSGSSKSFSDSDQVEIDSEISETGTANTVKNNCDIFKIENIAATFGENPQVADDIRTDDEKMEGNISKCDVTSIEVCQDGSEMKSDSIIDKELGAMSCTTNQQTFDPKMDEDISQSDPITQKHEIIPETTLEENSDISVSTIDNDKMTPESQADKAMDIP